MYLIKSRAHLTGVCDQAGPHSSSERIHNWDERRHGSAQPPLLGVLHTQSMDLMLRNQRSATAAVQRLSTSTVNSVLEQIEAAYLRAKESGNDDGVAPDLLVQPECDRQAKTDDCQRAVPADDWDSVRTGKYPAD